MISHADRFHSAPPQDAVPPGPGLGEVRQDIRSAINFVEGQACGGTLSSSCISYDR